MREAQRRRERDVQTSPDLKPLTPPNSIHSVVVTRDADIPYHVSHTGHVGRCLGLGAAEATGIQRRKRSLWKVSNIQLYTGSRGEGREF